MYGGHVCYGRVDRRMVSKVVMVRCPFCGSDKISKNGHIKRVNKYTIAIIPNVCVETLYNNIPTKLTCPKFVNKF